MSLREAIESYHELLTDELASESQAKLDDQQQVRGITFGGRPLCSVLRPRFMTPEQYRFLQTRVRLLLHAFDKTITAPWKMRRSANILACLTGKRNLCRHDSGFRAPSPTSRVDTFFVHGRGGLRLTEYNAETPASPAYNDVLADVFYGLPVMREFLHHYEVRYSPYTSQRPECADRRLPAMGRPSRSATYRHSRLERGAKLQRVCDVCQSTSNLRGWNASSQIHAKSSTAMVDSTAGDFHITLIYKRVLISELVERGGLDQPVIQAVRDGAVCMVNPFRCKILHKKASLAVLSDERNSDLFNDAEWRQSKPIFPGRVASKSAMPAITIGGLICCPSSWIIARSWYSNQTTSMVARGLSWVGKPTPVAGRRRFNRVDRPIHRTGASDDPQ